ncbi:MAG: LPS export ABC transporter periplasmic protein LptC [Candidatus Binataceae bacterium]|nr:LPS export ABC transporter periplasmic protein LptC [Candidatus Binataceae bacterium]
MSPKRIARILAGFGILALGAILIITIGVVRRRSPEHRPTTTQILGLVPGTLLHARNFHWTQMKGGQKEWILTARDARYSDDRTSVLLKDAKVTMIAEDGKEVMLDAPAVRLEVKGNHVQQAHMSGGVTVHYGEFTTTTDQATFVPDQDQLTAPGAVVVTGQGLKVTGTGLIGHPKLQQFSLNAQVNTQITQDSKRAKSRQKS